MVIIKITYITGQKNGKRDPTYNWKTVSIGEKRLVIVIHANMIQNAKNSCAMFIIG